MTWNFVQFRGTLINDFLLNTLKTLFSLFRVLNPLLNGHLSISQNFGFPYILTVNLTSIQRSPLLSGRGHRLDFAKWLILHKNFLNNGIFFWSQRNLAGVDQS